MNDLAVLNNDGWNVEENTGTSPIVGKMVKFTTDGRFVCDKTETIPADTTLVAMAVVTCWVHWQGGKPIEHKVTRAGELHPIREDFLDQDRSQWPPGLNNEPSDPWRDTRYVHLIDPNTGSDFTFVSDTHGGRKGVGLLKAQIRNVRLAHPSALPVVQLASAMMPTRFGQKPRPDFKIVSWRGKDEARPSAAASTTTKKVAVIPADGDMDDDIPF
jgi:hypothetical protein